MRAIRAQSSNEKCQRYAHFCISGEIILYTTPPSREAPEDYRAYDAIYGRSSMNHLSWTPFSAHQAVQHHGPTVLRRRTILSSHAAAAAAVTGGQRLYARGDDLPRLI